MDNDRIKGAAQQAKGAVKEVAGKSPAMRSSRRKEKRTRLLENSKMLSAA